MKKAEMSAEMSDYCGDDLTWEMFAIWMGASNIQKEKAETAYTKDGYDRRVYLCALLLEKVVDHEEGRKNLR